MAFTVTNLSKRHGKNWVLRDVSLTVEDGEIVGVFGAAGSGKTALLELLVANGSSGVQFPSAETSSLWSVFGSKPKARGTAAIDVAVKASEGVILLADPFAGLDRLGKIEQFARLRAAVKDKPVSIVVATSDFDEVMACCDRVLVLDGGTLAQDGPPEDVYHEPATQRIALLTGRCNLLRARRVTSTKSNLPEFVTITGEHRLFAVKADNFSLGPINQDISLAIRPEQISLSFGASFPEDNLLKAEFTGYKFLGPQTIIELNADGLTLEASVPRLVGLNIGDECMVGLPPDRLRILKN
jgi:ABC-type Fe3+/spermidine/putrescine transport system ATPase subunit